MAGKILIYGGSGGIGSEIAKILNKRGYELHLVGRDEDKMKKIAAEVNANYTIGDVHENDFFAQVASEAGSPLDGLIYAVGSINLKSLRRATLDDFMEDLRVNAVGAALAIQAVLPALNSSSYGASIVLFSSVAALQGFKSHSSIGMAKGAINGLTISLATEFSPKIRVNAIAPSLTRTPLAASMIANEQVAETIASMHAIPRLGNPEDIAKLAAFLVSSDAEWITGQIISVDGGRSTLRTKG